MTCQVTEFGLYSQGNNFKDGLNEGALLLLSFPKEHVDYSIETGWEVRQAAGNNEEALMAISVRGTLGSVGWR